MRVGLEPTSPFQDKGFQDLPDSHSLHLTLAESVGVEPTNRFRDHGLANHSLDRARHSPLSLIIIAFLTANC